MRKYVTSILAVPALAAIIEIIGLCVLFLGALYLAMK